MQRFEFVGPAQRAHREFRSRVLASWVTCNWVLAQALSNTSGLGSTAASAVSYSAPALLLYGYVLGALAAFSLGARVLVGSAMRALLQINFVNVAKAFPLETGRQSVNLLKKVFPSYEPFFPF
jgi:hypothetical protein